MSNKHLEQFEDSSTLIIRYLSGNASDEEVRQLEEWVLESPANRERFLAEKQTWFLAASQEKDDRIDVNAEWDLISKKLFDRDQIVPISGQRTIGARNWIGIAATIAIAVMASVWMFWPSQDQQVSIAAHDQVIEQLLPDGSRISLNRNASIVYSPNVNGRRLVSLQGDAFFEVARDEQHPFVVSTRDVEVEVLGTSFYVDSRLIDSSIKVVVETGLVALRHDLDEIQLSPGELGIFDKKTSSLSQLQNADQNYLSWKSDILNFQDVDLIQVVEVLNRHFDAEISIEDDVLNDCKINAVFTNKSLDAIIRIIERTLNISSKGSGDEIILFGTGCE